MRTVAPPLSENFKHDFKQAKVHLKKFQVFLGRLFFYSLQKKLV